MPHKLIRFLSLCLCFLLLFEQTGLAQVLPSALTTPLASPPLLRYLSVNSNNPFNYFNFLLDKGDTSEVAKGLLGGGSGSLNSQAKKLINYFFLGITLPSSAFWVNLRPDSPDKITSTELSKTDLGRVLLEQDLRLKKDVSKYLHPNHPQGKQYWERLYSTIGKDKAKKAKITTQNRVWIVPEEAVVLETEDGALVVSAKLKVLLESEYLSLKTKRWNKEVEIEAETKDEIKDLSENLMKEIILPALTQDINTSPHYAPLRQIYHSLILAEWFKRKIKDGSRLAVSGLRETPTTENRTPNTEIQSPYALAIDKGYLKGLESETPWGKDFFYQQYLKSYSQGEYKLEANLFGLRRMYWSGGMLLGLGPEVNPDFKFDIIPCGSSPLQENKVIPQDTLTNAITVTYEDNSILYDKGLPKGKIEVHATSSMEESEGASRSPEKGLSVEDQPESGASEKEETASSAVEQKGVVGSTTPFAEVLEKFALVSEGKNVSQEWMLISAQKYVEDYQERLKDNPNSGIMKERLRAAEEYLEALRRLPKVEKAYELTGPPSIEEIQKLAEKFKIEVSLKREKGTGRWVVSTLGRADWVGSGKYEYEFAIDSEEADLSIHNHPPGLGWPVPSDVDDGIAGERYDESKKMDQISEINLIVTKEGVTEFSVKDVIKDDREKIFELKDRLNQEILELVGRKAGVSLEELKQFQEILETDQILNNQQEELEAKIKAKIEDAYNNKLITADEIFNHCAQIIKEMEGLGYRLKFAKWGESAESLLTRTITSSPLLNENTSFVVERKTTYKTGLDEAARPGGIDLSQIDLTLKDEKFISSLNPAERKILLAGKYLKEGWYSLCLLYVHETMLLFKDNLIKDIQNRNILQEVLRQLSIKDFLDPQTLQFFQLIQSQKPFSEIKMAMVN